MVTPGQMQMFNKPEPYEAQILSSQYKSQYEYQPSSEIPCFGKYTLRLQDHTLGNALRMELLKDVEVLFAGYRNPHPLFPEIELRIRTSLKSSPQLALYSCNRRLIDSAENLLENLGEEMLRVRATQDPTSFPPEMSIEDVERNSADNPLYEQMKGNNFSGSGSGGPDSSGDSDLLMIGNTGGSSGSGGGGGKEIAPGITTDWE